MCCGLVVCVFWSFTVGCCLGFELWFGLFVYGGARFLVLGLVWWLVWCVGADFVCYVLFCWCLLLIAWLYCLWLLFSCSWFADIVFVVC